MGGFMVYFIVILVYFITMFLYCSLVVAKEADEFEYVRKDKDA